MLFHGSHATGACRALDLAICHKVGEGEHNPFTGDVPKRAEAQHVALVADLGGVLAHRAVHVLGDHIAEDAPRAGPWVTLCERHPTTPRRFSHRSRLPAVADARCWGL